MTPDPREIYWLEHYLFSCVSPRFAKNQQLSAFDFFCIVIWKANRAKSIVARRLLKLESGDLDSVVGRLTREVAEANNSKEPKERLRVLVKKWGFRLPMASAILTVLYPDDFSVYDVRVCSSLSDFKPIRDSSEFDLLWRQYEGFLHQVRVQTPAELSLRDRDRWLWGKSFGDQLRGDIAAKFVKPQPVANAP